MSTVVHFIRQRTALVAGTVVVTSGLFGLYWHRSFSTASSVPPSPSIYGPVTILQSVPVNDTSILRRITVSLPPSTAHLVNNTLVPFHFDIKNADLVVARSYTPIHYHHRESCDFLIKSYPIGETSNWMHRQPIGGHIEMCGPLNEWILPSPPPELPDATLTMIAGGTGVTPFIQILGAAFNHPTSPAAKNAAQWSKFSVLYFVSSEVEILERKWLDELAAKHPHQLTVRYITGGRRDLTPQLLKHSLPDPGKGLIIVCGPDGFVRTISGSRGRDLYSQGPLGGILLKLGYSAHDVYKME